MPQGRVKIRVERAARIFLRAGVVAFENLTLDLYDDEIACLVGPSGCGKTTLLRCIDGLLPLSDGQILLEGRPVRRPPEKVAVVFQHFGLFPWRSVYANAAYGLKLSGAPRDRIDARVSAVLKLVGLDGFTQHYPYQLSGGMQQRVGLARALATDPDVLLMDEPFAALDAQTRALMEEELLALWQQLGATVLFVTHDLEEAIALSDRVLLLTAGPRSRLKGDHAVDLPRPRNVVEARFTPGFSEIYERVWSGLREEVLASYARTR